MTNNTGSILPKWLDGNSGFESVRLAVCDLNGVLRGKRFPLKSINKLLKNGSRLPLSTSCIDIWGADLINSPFLFETGDGDGIVKPTGANLIPITWLDHPSVLLPSWMNDEKNNPSPVDPRHILNDVLCKYAALGLNPVLAFELEFYLLDPGSDKLLVSKNPKTKTRLKNTSALSIDELDSFENFFADVSIACKDHSIPSDTVISENGVGQFEINLHHNLNGLVAADHAVFLKRIVKGVAQNHSLKASFMAKPFLGRAGNGMHLHMSINDSNGANIFSPKNRSGNNILKHAVGGLIESLVESTLIFAPHLNSYRRLKPGSHAPTSVCWGYENRTASIRIPGGEPENTRIEHRVAGADANPYLVAAAVLSASLSGIQKQIEPPAPIKGDSYAQNLDEIPANWLTAIDIFRSGNYNKSFYCKTFREVFSNLKLQELETFGDRMEDFEVMTYAEV